ncbi:MAG: ornithine aminomutase subunit alpha [Peptostreptococcaceae bacterium]
MKKRLDDFKDRRAHLENLSDEELKLRFWSLANEIVQPMLDLGRKNTSPSIERSVLLRMGFSSLEAKEIVNGVIDKGLMGKGAGHVVYKLAKEKNISVREAGVMLVNGQGWDEVETLFAKEGATC